MDAEAGCRELFGRTVLVVEDNAVNLKLVRDILEHHGYTVFAAADGEEGVASAKRHRPSLVLMDLQLPKLDGFAAIREIRCDPVIGSVPIVALTGFAMATDRERALEAGATDFVAKPFSLHTLLEAVRRLAGPAQGAG